MRACLFEHVTIGGAKFNFFEIGHFGAAGTTTSVGALGDPVAAPELMANSA